jgi:hypothetical protein
MRKWIAIWLASLVMVAGLTTVLIRAQVQVPPLVPNTPSLTPRPAPPADAWITLSGSDIGFRVEGHKDGNAVGTLLVRINGTWVKAMFSPTSTRLSQR